MNVYGVTITVEDFYFEIAALNQEDAIDDAFHLAYDQLSGNSDPILDCNECILLEGEEPDEEDEDD